MQQLIKFFKSRKQFLYATAALVGTMVGVGIFGIPFSFAKAGFFVGFLFLLLVMAVMLLVDLMYGEVILRTEGNHQITGYVQRYGGRFLKSTIFFAIALSMYSALLAYIIIAGDFLTNIFSPLFYMSPGGYSVIFAIVLSVLIFLGVKRFSIFEFFLAAMFIAVVMVIFGFGLPHIDLNNLKGVVREFWFLPYGILLFAFAGMASIPIQRQILKGKEQSFKKSIFSALILVGALYALFGLTVVGISGEVTSPDSVSGLYEFLGGKIVFLGSLFGILAVSSGFLMLGSALMGIFMLDFKEKKWLAWGLAVLPPVALFLSGVRTFINVIGMAGAVAIGLELMVIVFIYARAKSRGDRIPEYSLNVPIWLLYVLIFMFGAGVAYALFF